MASLSCPGQPCLTLHQYTQQTATYFTIGSTFLFLPGYHILLTTINLTGISDIEFRSMEYQSSAITINIVSALNCSNSTLTVNNCHFKGNEGKYGGAIYVELFTNLEITDSTFINNKACFNGGAIYAEDSCVSVKQTSHNVSATFSGNFARQDGGAIILYLNSMTDDVLFSGTVILFEDNCSGHRGGGICSVLSDFAFNSTILFHGNIANYGGALWSSNGKILLSRHTFFKNNSAHDKGGALYGSKTDIQFDKNVTFSYNSAIKGGAMYLEDQTVLQFTSSLNLNTSYNTASEYGGAIYHKDEETLPNRFPMIFP